MIPLFSGFLKKWCPDKPTTFQWKGTRLRISGQHELALVGIKRHKLGGKGSGAVDLGGAVGGRVDMIKTHKILKEPIKSKNYYCPLPRQNMFVILELKIKSINI